MPHGKRVAAFSIPQKQTLTSVLDEIIPRSDDGRMPAAGALGLANPIDKLAQDEPELRDLIAQGLARLDELARAQRAPAFCTLSAEGKAAALDEIAKTLPRFLVEIARHTYAAYNKDPRVVVAIGLEASASAWLRDVAHRPLAARAARSRGKLCKDV
jgi:hypothetical protein